MSNLKNYVLSGKHFVYRTAELCPLAEQFQKEGLSFEERMTRRFELACKVQSAVILPDQKIVFMRTLKNLPDVLTDLEWQQIRKEKFIHELGYHSNFSPDYEYVLNNGLIALKERSDAYCGRMVDALLTLVEKYREQAIAQGKNDVADSLRDAPKHGAKSFREALQLFRIFHFALWLEGNYHNTCGAFDRYMYPFFKSDLESGVITEKEALELLEDFFISFNIDSDLYPGVQQGDNGQSMVLGGMDESGNDVFNKLSELCLEASYNNLMIDPKINLRVCKNTPVSVYELGSKLTKAGLGFPQYSNDDVVVKGLIDKGYAFEDAVTYVVAACWEFIIPKVGFDVNNIGALSFPKVVDNVLRSGRDFSEYKDFICAIKEEIFAECERITSSIKNLWFVPSPLLCSVLYPKYRNFGIHGTGIATASDSVAVIKEYVFDKKEYSLKDIRIAIETDFDGAPDMLRKFRFEAPKMGQAGSISNSIATELLDMFADALDGKINCEGGIYRAGTGSAMFYLRHAEEIGASPDGRRKGEPFGTNYSPSLFAETGGPLSVISSFTEQNLGRVINGGPLTLEFSSSMFDEEQGVSKVAKLVKAFIDMGGHQLQLNAVNAEKMKDAQKNPEKYRSLVVRIWGWSAYFTELDKEYQDHVIARREYSV